MAAAEPVAGAETVPVPCGAEALLSVVRSELRLERSASALRSASCFAFFSASAFFWASSLACFASAAAPVRALSSWAVSSPSMAAKRVF